MARPGPSSSTGAGQGAGTDPEAQWFPFIKEHYPDLLNETQSFPPVHFNRTPCVVANIAGQIVHVRDNPSTRRRPHQPANQHEWQYGSVSVQNSPDSQDMHVQDSDQQDDRAQESCFSALLNIKEQVMMVISNLEFKKYLSNNHNLRHAAASQLPTAQDPCLPQHIQDGECDIVVIHRHYGLLVGEIKSVGASSYFQNQTPAEQTLVIKKKVERALEQLQNQEKALRHLQSDLPPVTIRKVLMLPNITSRQLREALDSDTSLLQKLCQGLSLPQDVEEAVRHCLCKEDVENPNEWWRRLQTGGPDPCMDDHLYTRLVARFCGPATTVDVPTAGPPRKVLRSQGQAVAETGLRFSSLVLTPFQVTLLSRQPEAQYLFLYGPPGTGKTVCLYLKALLWLQQGRRVLIVSGGEESRAVSRLLQEQLRTAGPAAATIDRHCCDLSVRGFNAAAEVRRLRQQMGQGPFSVIFDEFGDLNDNDSYIAWMTEIRAQLPDVTVWMAGVYRLNTILTRQQLPPWLEVQTLQESLRCPPTVTKLLQQSDVIRINDTLRYTAPQHPVATQGPPVKEMQHWGQPGHSGVLPRQCVTCADHVIDYLTNQLRVGQPGHELQHRDVFILYGFVDVPRAGDVLIQRLQERGLPVRLVTSYPPSAADVEELALAVTDAITVVYSHVVHGLERRIVIALCTGAGVTNGRLSLPAISRTCSALYYIE